jgi:hypothetical protein
VLAGLAGAGKMVSETEEQRIPASSSTVTDDPATAQNEQGTRNKVVFFISGFVALACLILCLLLPLWLFFNPLENFQEQVAEFQNLLLWITVVYFISGMLWICQFEKQR